MLGTGPFGNDNQERGRIAALEHVNKAAAKAHEAALDDAHRFRCALQEALAREAGLRIALEKARHIIEREALGGSWRRSVLKYKILPEMDQALSTTTPSANWAVEKGEETKRADTAETALQEALEREAGQDAALREIRTMAPYSIEGDDLSLDYAEVCTVVDQALSATTPHPWGEVVRAAQQIAEWPEDAIGDEYQQAIRKLRTSVAALPTSASPSDTAALIEAGRMAVELTKVGGDWWSWLDAGPTRDIAVRLHSECADIIEKEK